MGGLAYKIRKNLEVFGPFYMRILVASIVLMVSGLVMFSFGMHILGYKIAFLPDIPVLGYTSEYYIYYYQIDYISSQHFFMGAANSPEQWQITSFEVENPGKVEAYVEINRSLVGAELYLVIVSETTGAVIENIRVPTESPGEHRVSAEIPPGRYTIILENWGKSSGYVSVGIRILATTEKPVLKVAKWLQGVGLAFMGLGLVVFILSYEIARREAEVSYMVAPKEFRELIARESYLRLLSSDVTRPPPEYLIEEEVEEEEYTD